MQTCGPALRTDNSVKHAADQSNVVRCNRCGVLCELCGSCWLVETIGLTAEKRGAASFSRAAKLGLFAVAACSLDVAGTK